MKLHPEDPRLTAYVLGELGDDEAAAVGRAIDADPALQAEVREIESIRGSLASCLEFPHETLLPTQRTHIRRNARLSSRPPGILKFVALRDAVQPWIIPASAAAVLAVATYILFSRPGDPKPATVSKNPDQAVPAQVESPAARVVAPATNLPEVTRRGSVAAADSRTLDLPVLSETAGMETILNSILNDKKLPPHESVKLEEILNSFPLRLNGVASISRSPAPTWHPDNRDSGMTHHTATLSTELIACPWKPSATLLLVSIRANAKTDSTVKITYHANPATVRSYRLLGYSPVDGRPSGKLPDRLPAGSVVNLALEIEPSATAGDFGTLEWSTDGEAAPPVSLVRKMDAEPSDDARFAALVCTFSLWLAGDRAGIIDAEVVAALAREVASSALPPERTDFLNLIDRSLHL